MTRILAMAGATSILLTLAAVPALAAGAADPALSDAANQAFLKKFASEKGVHVTPSGLEYKVLQAGRGPQPTANDTVIVTYKGQLINGRVFDETKAHEAASFPVGQLIPGWTEALQRMHEGDHWTLVIPARLAYGAEGAGKGIIPPNQTLVFDLDLVKVQPAAAAPAAKPTNDSSLSPAANQAFLKKFAAQKGVQVTNSGIEIKILQNGFGKRPTGTDKVMVNYKGELINGRVFDQTEPGLPATFKVNELIPGWTEALQRMREGDHWQIAIPSRLAYGSNGAGDAIPPDQTLVFDLELIKVLPPEKQAPDDSQDQGQ